MNFICVSCGKSLLSESRIMCDVRDNQYCVKCWKEDEKKRSRGTQMKFPVGSKVTWQHALTSKSRSAKKKIVAVVTECSHGRIRIQFGKKQRTVDEDELTAYVEE